MNQPNLCAEHEEIGIRDAVKKLVTKKLKNKGYPQHVIDEGVEIAFASIEQGDTVHRAYSTAVNFIVENISATNPTAPNAA